MAKAAAWRLNLHGDMQLLPPDARPALPLTRKDAAWLAHTALEGPVPSLRLATLLWPAAGERGALNNLRQRVHRLRKASGARLVEMAATVALADDLQLELPDLAALAATAAGAPGHLLRGLDFDDAADFAAWLAQRRLLQQEQWRDTLAQQAAQAETDGRLVDALACAQRLLALDGLSEHGHRRLMRLHYLRGDRAAALRAFEACEQALKDEFGVPPGAETLALLQTVEDAGTAAAAVATPVPARLLRPPRTVGRDGPAQALTQAHAEGLVAVLVAEAGLGKSRLLQDFVAARPQAVYAQARPSDATVPYGALARLLRQVLAAAAPNLPPESRRALACIVPELAADPGVPAHVHSSSQLQAAVAALLASAAAHGHDTLVVDDLHFADRASVELLLVLIETPAPLRWLFAHRPADGAGDPNTSAALLASLAEAPAVQCIALAPLDTPALLELLSTLGLAAADAAALLPALQRHAGGNPLYVLETLRAVTGALQPGATLPRPAGIERLIDKRLQRLSRPALALARLAAIAVPDFSIELAEQALQAPALALADAWGELEAADVLRGEAFAHDLVHDAVLRATPEVVAARAHRQVAAFLAHADAEPARIALHWRAGGDAAAAAASFSRAAARAEQASRPQEQARLLLDAAEQWRAAGEPERALLLQADAVEPLIVADGLQQALEISTRMVAQPAGAEVAGRLWAVHAMALVWAGRSADAEAAAREALRLQATAAATPAAARAKAELALGMALSNQGHLSEGLAVLRPLWQQVETLADVGQRIDVCGAYSIVLAHLHRNGEGMEVVQRQLLYARARQSRLDEVNALMSLAFFALRRGEIDAGIAACEAARRLGQADRELTSLTSMNDIVLGDAYVGAGRYGEGITLLEAAITHAEQHLPDTNHLALARQCLANAFLQLGRPELAQRLALQQTAGSSIDNEVHRHALLARLLEQRGDAGARAAWEKTAALAGQRNSAPALLAQLELARAEGGATGLARAATVLQQAETTEQAVVMAAALTCRLELAAAAGNSPPEMLAGWAAQAARLAQQHRSSRVYFPALLLALGRELHALGRHEQALRCWRDGWAWVESVAGPKVPPAFRRAFLERNPVNLALRRQLQRLTHSPALGAAG